MSALRPKMSAITPKANIPCFASVLWACNVGHDLGGELTMGGKAMSFLAGVLLASMFWIVLAQQNYCTGGLADWLKMGDVEECR